MHATRVQPAVLAPGPPRSRRVGGVAERWRPRTGPYPRILDTGCDYAAVASVAARRAS